MGLMQMLYQTYENNIHMVGKSLSGRAALAPVYHVNTGAQIEIAITSDGEFFDAEQVPKKSSDTIIPSTPSAAGRSSGSAPYPLSDKLQYVAFGLKSYEHKHEDYMNLLKEWADSEFSHPKVRAVYKYCSSGTIIYDLSRAGVIKIDDTGKLAAGKIEAKAYADCIVRWRVMPSDEDDYDYISEAWLDNTLIQSYIDFYSHSISQGKSDLCYISGKNLPTAQNHGRNIITQEYGAKLISANDTSNFTYRGRFIYADEAMTVGEESEQKATAALRWLVRNQAIIFGDMTFLCWNPGGKDVPKYIDRITGPGYNQNATNILDEESKNKAEDEYEEKENDDKYEDDEEEEEVDDEEDYDDEEDEDEDEDGDEADDDDDKISANTPNTMPLYKDRLYRALAGIENKLDERDDILILSLKSATPGRLSVTHYGELKKSDFITNLKHWYETACFYFGRYIGTPSVKTIVKCAFGRVADNVISAHSLRILLCITEGRQIPYDIVHALVVRASMPQLFTGNIKASKNKDSKSDKNGNKKTKNADDKSYEYEKVLSTACAVIRKYYNDKNKNERKEDDIYMELDYTNTNRSYLFGRLLAVIECIERSTFDKDETREPNAKRMQSVFVQRPMSTWAILEVRLNPYYEKLSPGLREYYKKIIQDITSLLKREDSGKLNNTLDDIYLIGYYLQRAELYKKKNKTEDNDNENT